MSNVKNRVILTGFAGADPVIVEFPNERRVARVNLAINEFYRDSAGEFVNKTQWFTLVFWNQKIKLIDGIVKKGTNLSIEGKLSTQTYTNKKGEQRFAIEIVVHALSILTPEEA